MSKNTPTEDWYGRVGINPIERRKKRKTRELVGSRDSFIMRYGGGHREGTGVGGWIKRELKKKRKWKREKLKKTEIDWNRKRRYLTWSRRYFVAGGEACSSYFSLIFYFFIFSIPLAPLDQEITLTGLPLPNQGSSIRIAFSGSSHSRPSRDIKNSTTIQPQYVDTTGRPVPSWPPQKRPSSYTMRDFCLGRGYLVISLTLRSRTRALAQIDNCMSRTILLFPGEFTYRIVYKIV